MNNLLQDRPCIQLLTRHHPPQRQILLHQKLESYIFVIKT